MKISEIRKQSAVAGHRALDRSNKLEAGIHTSIAQLAEHAEGIETRLATFERAAATPAGKKPLFRGVGEFLQSVRRAAVQPELGIDPRLTNKRAVSGLNETVDSDGGFLVDDELAAALLLRAYETTNIAKRCLRVPVSRSKVSYPQFDETSRANGSRSGGVQAYWLGEGDTITATKPKFRTATLELKKLVGLCYVTDELLEDAALLEAALGQAFADEFAFQIDKAIFDGLGAGMPLGIKNSPALITVSKEAGQAAGTITPDNVSAMWARCWGPSRRNAIWLINQDTEASLYKTADWTQSPGIFTPAGQSASGYCELFGRPVIPVEFAEVVGTKGDITLMDPSRYLLIDAGSTTDVSMHVRFVENESAFRFKLRIDGQPLDNSPLTPYKGSATLSPFVTLAERA